MTRETSIEAYHKAKALGVISGRRLEVYKILCEHGPMTAGEILGYNNSVHSGVYTTRLSELKAMGAIKEIGKRACDKTGFTAIVWEITGDMPVKPPKKLTRKEKKEKVLDKIVALGKKPMPTTVVEFQLYKKELRVIFVTIRDDL